MIAQQENNTGLAGRDTQMTVRKLTALDVDAYRRLRQRILEIGEGKYFNTSYERESQLTDQQWVEWCTETRKHCIFGLFDGACLVGVMMATQYSDLDDLTVEWEATWIDPAYRGQGVAGLGYESIHRWTVEQGYKNVIVFIREDNIRSRSIREKQGFTYVKTILNEHWADGSIASEHVFTKDLSVDLACKNLHDVLLPLIESHDAVLTEVVRNNVA